MTTSPTNGGTACPTSPETRSCTNCAGSWNSWSACSSGSQSRDYVVTTSPTNGGTACPTSPETRSCTPSPSPTPSVNCAGSWGSWGTCSSGSSSRSLPSRPTHPVEEPLARLQILKAEVVPIVLDPGTAGPYVVVDLKSRDYVVTTSPTNGGTACP